MKRVGFFRAARLVALKDLRLEWRTLETLSSTLIFSLIVLVIFNFAFGLSTLKQLGAARLVPGVIWIVIAFSAVVGMARSFQLERSSDTLSALFLAPVDRGALFAGKFAANLVKIGLLEVVVLPLTAVFFDYNLIAVIGPMAIVLAIHTLGLTILGTLFSAIAARLGRGEALVSTLLFPAASPLFISAVKSTSTLLDGRSLSAVSNWLLLSTGFDALYLMLALLTFEFVLED
jgi:heme exporter protein B